MSVRRTPSLSLWSFQLIKPAKRNSSTSHKSCHLWGPRYLLAQGRRSQAVEQRRLQVLLLKLLGRFATRGAPENHLGCSSNYGCQAAPAIFMYLVRGGDGHRYPRFSNLPSDFSMQPRSANADGCGMHEGLPTAHWCQPCLLPTHARTLLSPGGPRESPQQTQGTMNGLQRIQPMPLASVKPSPPAEPRH